MYPFSLPNNIPLYGYTTFCLSIHQLTDIWVVSTFLAVMNYAAMNIHVQVFMVLKIIYFFIYFCLHWVFIAVHGVFSSCCKQGLLFVAVAGFSLRWLLSCGAWALGAWASVVAAAGSVVVAHGP